MLERGEKLDDLVQKTDMLSGSSKAFYKEVCMRVVLRELVRLYTSLYIT